MRRTVQSLVVFVSASLLAAHAVAAPFDPLFRVTKVQGNCQVMPPNTTAFVAAEDGKAYPYGTQIVTADGGTLEVALSPNSGCQVSAGARLKVSERPDDKAIKQIYLEQGRLDIALPEEFETANGLEVVAHCSTITCLKGGKSFVEVKTEQDLHSQLIGSADTQLRVKGPQFDIAVLKKEQWVSVSCASNRRFVRVKSVKGDIIAMIQGADAQSKDVTLQPGATIKVMQKNSEVPGAIIVAILVVAPDGTPADSITYSTAGEGLAETPPEPPAAPGAKPTPPTPSKGGEWEPMWSATPTTTTTTTTRPAVPPRPVIPPTPPTPTPVGRR